VAKAKSDGRGVEIDRLVGIVQQTAEHFDN
jgi:hypothetical protein